MKSINNVLLQEIFEASGYTSIELAAHIGISRNTVHNTMYGVTSPSYYVTTSLAMALELSDQEIIAIFFPKAQLQDLQKEAQ